ncbi:acyl-CoA N-acyltransferase [Xylogone sp. PMI_703]|nr:acyl-CoA N-acyltransferase [Xylogone sp. PMI_703]
MEPIQISQLDPTRHEWLIPALVELHIDSILGDNALMRYHPPFDAEKRAKMLSFWKERIDQVRSKRRIIIVATTANSSQEQGKGVENDLCAVVELSTPDADTGPFRGDIEMLMVSPKYRRFGLAKRMMAELEKVALEQGRTLLQLCTTVGSPAEVYLYPRLGYTKIGVVPNYGIVPNTGELVDGAYFYKDLRVEKSS